LRTDLIAGLSLAAFAIPESIAYATLAGLPPVTGLYCYLVGGIAYALFGTSPQLAIGPTSAIALLIGSSLMPLAGGEIGRYALLASATASLVGVICFIARFVRIGYVVNFVSSVVLTGFKTGAALFIASTQLPKIFGVPGGFGSFFERIAALTLQLPQAHLASVVMGVGAIAALLILAHRFPGRPTTIAVVAAILVMMHADALARLGIHVAGRIPYGLPVPGLSVLVVSADDLSQLLPIALACFILAYVETITTGRSFAEAHGDVVDVDDELLALGTANIAAGAFQGFPVSGGMSQTAVNDLAGARSPISLVTTSAAVAIVLLFFAAFFSVTPEPLLGAIVVVAAIHLVRVGDIVKIWRSSRHEFWVAFFAAVAVLATGLLSGVMWAVVFSLLMVLARASRPEIAVLGELPGTTLYVNVEFNADAVVPEGVLAVRAFGPWQYFNAGYIRQRILQLVDASASRLRLVVIDFSASPTLDVQSVATLKTIDDDLHARGIQLRLARLYDETANKLRRTRDVRAAFDSHESIHDIVVGYLSAQTSAPPPGASASG
jgi:high affinity sulfate transporter 1